MVENSDLLQKTKLESFTKDIKSSSSFQDKLNNLHMVEFEENFQEILILSKTELLNQISDCVKMILSEMYSEAISENQELDDFLDVSETLIKKEYKTHYQILFKAWKNYSSRPFSVNYLTHFRKHCASTTNEAYHSCNNRKGAKLIEVKVAGVIKYVICIECRKAFFAEMIHLHCSQCNVDYYSSMLSNEEDKNMLPATWEKYHCEQIINEKMKCIKCRELLYLNLKTKMLQCINSKCNFTSKPLSIVWTCAICKVDFRSEAIVYNPLEIKFIKKVIKQTLLIKHKAHPNKISCCKLNIFFTDFNHKKECSGILYRGDLNGKMIIVCEKCKAINYYERFIWSCPKCEKRFRDNQTIVQHTKQKDNDESITSRNSHSYLYKSEITQEFSKSENVFANSPLRCSQPRNLFDILQKRSGQESAKKNRFEIFSPQKDENVNNKIALTCANEELQATPIKKKVDLNYIARYSPIKHIIKMREEGSPMNRNSKFESKKETITFEEETDDKDKKNPFSIKKESVSKEKRKEKSNQQIQQQQQDDEEVKKKREKELTPYELNNKRLLLRNERRVETMISKGRIFLFNIDEYNIIKQAGEGSYGKIYIVESKLDQTRYALKKIIAHDLTEVECFKKEFELVNSITHENIMKIFGICIKCLDITTFAIYVLMELAILDWDDEIRNHVSNRKSYKEEELISILRSLTNALAFMQKNTIAHRDIKPQNVLVFKGGVYKVADFGEAKELKISKQLNTLRGTELYMSPVLYEGLKQDLQDVRHNTFKSDVFSLGFCFMFAASLNFNIIYEVRDVKDVKKLELILYKHLKNKYTAKFIKVLVLMLTIEENERPDFIELEQLLNQTFLNEDKGKNK